MNYTIKNEYLEVVISSNGGELQSIKGKSGNEYLWQGDPNTWKDRAPNIFPYVARLTKGTYRYQGEEYQLPIHGFIIGTELTACNVEETAISFRLDSQEETRTCYPFAFTYLLHYRLVEQQLQVTFEVQNHDTKEMYFGIGGHPGFRVPFEENTAFTDYYLEFAEEAHPSRITFSETCFVLGEEEHYQLRAGKYIDLRHDLFDQDAIVLHHMSKSVSLKSDKSNKKITVSYPDMDYLGFWHWPCAEVDYVCIEPWSSLPSRQDVVEDLETQENLIRLKPGKVYENCWSIKIEEQIER